MHLEAQLTTYWTADPSDPLSAKTLHTNALQAPDYSSSLESQLRDQPGPAEIKNLEHLFRKNPTAFQPIKRFIHTLKTLPTINGISHRYCHINVFAYTFLKGAKNFDFILPLASQQSPTFTHQYQNWIKTIHALEAFERSGHPLPKTQINLQATYLELRRIFTRPSARDEHRILVSLLISGPSTLTQLSSDLGLHYTLSQTTLDFYRDIGIVDQHRDSSAFTLSLETIPLIIFYLREALGLDLFRLLPKSIQSTSLHHNSHD